MAQKFKVSHDSPLLEYLFEIFPGQSRTGVKSYLKDGRVLVCGQECTAFDRPLKPGDTVEIISKGASIGRDMKSDARETLGKQGVGIVYEDDHIIVIDKNAGVPVSAPKAGSKDGRRQKSAMSLLNDYMHTEKRADIKAGTGNYKAPDRVFLVHRLDRDTSGLVIFTKDEYTKDLILSKWSEMMIEQRHVAAVEGRVKPAEGVIESWLSENAKAQKMVSSRDITDGQKAVTRYKVIEERARYSIVEFELETNRKNQIRVHAASELRHPLVGDRKYGSVLAFGGRIALHARTLVFKNPYGGRIMRFESPVPACFDRLK